MKDIKQDLKGQDQSSENILLQFIKKLVKTESYHILIDELEVQSSPSLLAALQAVKLGVGSLTVAIRGNTVNLDKLNIKEGSAMKLKKIMRMSTQVYETIKNLGPYTPIDATLFFGNSNVQHAVLGCKPEFIDDDKWKSFGLKETLLGISSHPAVVILSRLLIMTSKQWKRLSEPIQTNKSVHSLEPPLNLKH